MPIPKLIALYLPQFHPIPENDAWWGRGFTEWTNVAAARPHFRGHHQPHLPADLGFYDLRLAEAREAQATLASQNGIHGFCYYHYWFNGSRLLERPFNDVLSSRSPDFPFCLCWANENWTRAWDGQEREILKKQSYSNEDNRRHIDWLIRAFQDSRYIRIEGKPLFLIYRLHDIPNAGELLAMWRAQAQRQGLPGLYLCAMQTGLSAGSEAPLLRSGVDAIVDFQPNWPSFPASGNLIDRLAVAARTILPASLYQAVSRSVSATRVIDYGKVVDVLLKRPWPKNYTRFPCVFPSWDNSARRKAPTIIQNDDPGRYQRWLEVAIDAVRGYAAEQQVVFINAWNEWAEGCHLEPDSRNQHAFLNATAAALAASQRPR